MTSAGDRYGYDEAAVRLAEFVAERELLLARLRGGKPAETLVFAPELVVRRSTAPPSRLR